MVKYTAMMNGDEDMATDNIFLNFAERSIDELKRILEKLSKDSPKSFINTKEIPEEVLKKIMEELNSNTAQNEIKNGKYPYINISMTDGLPMLRNEFHQCHFQSKENRFFYTFKIYTSHEFAVYDSFGNLGQPVKWEREHDIIFLKHSDKYRINHYANLGDKKQLVEVGNQSYNCNEKGHYLEEEEKLVGFGLKTHDDRKYLKILKVFGASSVLLSAINNSANYAYTQYQEDGIDKYFEWLYNDGIVIGYDPSDYRAMGYKLLLDAKFKDNSIKATYEIPGVKRGEELMEFESYSELIAYLQALSSKKEDPTIERIIEKVKKLKEAGFHFQQDTKENPVVYEKKDTRGEQ